MPTAIEVQDLAHRFGRHWALAHVSFKLEDGESLLLTGHNGAGKTTLLRVLGTSLKPTRGSVQLFGKDAWKQRQAVRRDLGMLSHSHQFYQDLSSRENLELWGKLARVDTSSVPKVLEQVGLTQATHRTIRVFSAGMKRRLGLARLLLLRPKLLLLDEPFGQLDPDGVAMMESCMKQFRDQRTTMVISTHDLQRGRRLVSKELHLEQGRPDQPKPVGAG